MSRSPRTEIPALVVNQWLREWDDVRFAQEGHRIKPKPHFFMLTMPADWLRRLSNIYRRKAVGPRAKDTAIQRAHDPKRSEQIKRFIHGGFPWSDLSDRARRTEEYSDLRMPGWLPTAIIANVLPANAERGGIKIKASDLIQVKHVGDNNASLILPDGFSDDTWNPAVPPIEIIDGQHRLWAFEDGDKLDGDYELPVVAFYDLDITWQAYLFYTINIKPKRINASLAFDLYPILRIQDWLEKSPSGPAIYRETRAQELTEVLWSHPQSPWRGRINMLGESKSGSVTQAAFIRSLMASYIKRWEGKRIQVGGLFATELHERSDDVLRWARPQQAAFLILVWRSLADAIKQSEERWAKSIRELPKQQQLPIGSGDGNLDPAFAGTLTLLATDQGVRGVLQVTNDLCYVAADNLGLAQWKWSDELEDDITDAAVTGALQSLQQRKVREFLRSVCSELSKFDWRTSSFPDLSDDEHRNQMVFRGSGGYKELRRQLLHRLRTARSEPVRVAADDVWKRLGY